MLSDRSLSQRCVHEILDLLRQQKLQPGQRLGEVAMARRLKLGRAPVRAALDQLARAGLLERIARSGTFVRRITLQDWCELMDLRAGVESMAARLASTRLSAAELEKLAHLAKRLDQRSTRAVEKDVSSDPEVIELEREFHNLIAAASGNRKIMSLLENQRLLENSFLLGQALPSRRTAPKRTPTHADIVNALRKGPDEAAEVMLKHLLLTKECYLSTLVGLP